MPDTKPDTALFEFDRSYAVSAKELWRLLTDPAMRAKWGAPTEGTVLEMEVEDLRVGGEERHRCGPADNPEFVVTTRWYRLDAPALAAFTETLIIGGDCLATSLVTYRLTEVGPDTRLGVAVAVSSFAGPDVPAEFRGGWEGGLANLDRLVQDITHAKAS